MYKCLSSLFVKKIQEKMLLYIIDLIICHRIANISFLYVQFFERFRKYIKASECSITSMAAYHQALLASMGTRRNLNRKTAVLPVTEWYLLLCTFLLYYKCLHGKCCEMQAKHMQIVDETMQNRFSKLNMTCYDNFFGTEGKACNKMQKTE